MELINFYRTVWRGGFDGDETELEAILSRASDVVDDAIYLSGVEVKSVSELYIVNVFKAVCTQADHIDSCGGTVL